MAKHLLTIEDAFVITGRGVLVIPGPLLSEYTGPRRLSVRLVLPGGEEKRAILTLEDIRQTPAPKEPRWGCLLEGVEQDDLPAGTEVWI